MRIRRATFLLSFASALWIAIAGCGDDDDGATTQDAGPDVSEASTFDSSGNQDVGTDSRSPEFTGSACKAPADCYGTLDAASLKGEARCIDRVTNGYCTHTCTQDSDCCAVEGECKSGFKQVCAPFESTTEKYCFLSCEPSDITAAPDAGGVDGGDDGTQYCQKNASAEFGCRSTGGGQGNRKVCIPIGGGDGGKKDGEADADAADGDGG
jgi:hypothetical protein